MSGRQVECSCDYCIQTRAESAEIERINTAGLPQRPWMTHFLRPAASAGAGASGSGAAVAPAAPRDGELPPVRFVSFPFPFQQQLKPTETRLNGSLLSVSIQISKHFHSHVFAAPHRARSACLLHRVVPRRAAVSHGQVHARSCRVPGFADNGRRGFTYTPEFLQLYSSHFVPKAPSDPRQPLRLGRSKSRGSVPCRWVDTGQLRLMPLT